MEPADVRRIGFVTRRFQAIQGLRRVAWGLTIPPALWLASRVETGRSLAAVAWMLFICIVPGLVESRVGDYYAARAGRVAPNPRSSRLYRFPLLMAVLLAILYDSHFQAPGRPSIAALLLALVAVFDAIRDWPWRWYRAIDALACVAASAFWGLLAFPETSRVVTVVLLTCAGAVVTGYLDHRLLIRALGPLRGAVDEVNIEGINGA